MHSPSAILSPPRETNISEVQRCPPHPLHHSSCCINTTTLKAFPPYLIMDKRGTEISDSLQAREKACTSVEYKSFGSTIQLTGLLILDTGISATISGDHVWDGLLFTAVGAASAALGTYYRCKSDVSEAHSFPVLEQALSKITKASLLSCAGLVTEILVRTQTTYPSLVYVPRLLVAGSALAVMRNHRSADALMKAIDKTQGHIKPLNEDIRSREQTDS